MHKKAWSVIKAGAVKVLSPHRASLARLSDIPLTVAGVGCIDAGIFLASTMAGMIATGISLILIEHLIGDEQ